jgi:hypothetical protein
MQMELKLAQKDEELEHTKEQLRKVRCNCFDSATATAATLLLLLSQMPAAYKQCSWCLLSYLSFIGAEQCPAAARCSYKFFVNTCTRQLPACYKVYT